MTVDPYNITKYNRTKAELECFLLFCIVVAGKTAYIQAQKLDEFLKISEKNLLHSAGSVSAKEAKEKAEAEFEKYRSNQDKKYISDFDQEIKKLLKSEKK